MCAFFLIGGGPHLLCWYSQCFERRKRLPCYLEQVAFSDSVNTPFGIGPLILPLALVPFYVDPWPP